MDIRDVEESVDYLEYLARPETATVEITALAFTLNEVVDNLKMIWSVLHKIIGVLEEWEEDSDGGYKD